MEITYFPSFDLTVPSKRILLLTVRLLVLVFLFLAGTSLAAKAQESLPVLVKQIKPSVVTVITYHSKGEVLGQGSAFFITPTQIVSNRHVFEDAHRAEVKTADGKTYPIQGVVAEDKDGDLIQLLVSIPVSEIKPLKVAKALPQEGEKIIVVGSPFGLEQSISDGIVSSVRKIPIFGDIIQITAPISPGSSGSPVVNLRGEVVGIATLYFREGQNLNFAISAQKLKNLIVKNVQKLSVWTASLPKKKIASKKYKYDLTSLLGKTLDNTDLMNFMISLNEKPDPYEPEFDTLRYYISFKENGISLLFKRDELSTIFLYSKGHYGFQQYKGKIPSGVAFSDDRLKTNTKLGLPSQSGGGGASKIDSRQIPIWDKWRFPRYIVHVQYYNDGKVQAVTIMQDDVEGK